MYSRTKNTLTALAAAMVFVAGGWLFGHPVAYSAQESGNSSLPTMLADAGPQDAREFSALRVHRANRMNLSMPYFSFVQVLPQRRND
jgi:hypothetical protein